jgi:diguanylate cyclase (GGDEF)-like protein
MRSFVGADRLRFHAIGGEGMLSRLPTILRQLNYVEEPAGGGRTLGEPRDVYLVDGTLPDALDICRDLPAGAGRILTADHPSFAHRKLCAEVGIDALVADPIDPRELGDWLEYFDGRGCGGRATVLIVDDDELAAEAVAALLVVRGIEVEIIVDPTQVFEVLDRCSFDLILMDLDMPHVDGIELARMIRLNRCHLSVPIVFLSAGGDTETQMLARRFGGDDFISKRIPRDLLGRLVELRVERARVLRTLIERDGLTGLVDHLRFVERIGQELARSRRTGNDCSLVMIDIDHFKSVNDTWGHQAGDHVLRRLASALVSWLRRTDVVGRYGGEEFGVLMLDTPPERAAPVIDAFRRHVSALDMIVGDAVFNVSFSAGIAGLGQAADTATLITAADEALYRAKVGGRDRVVVSDRIGVARRDPAPGPAMRAGGSPADPSRSLGETGATPFTAAAPATAVPTREDMR